MQADTRRWIKNNWVDYIVPQIYWPLGFAPAAYDVLVPWWVHEERRKVVHYGDIRSERPCVVPRSGVSLL